jgi:uncharacterized protein with PQ loop repeat
MRTVFALLPLAAACLAVPQFLPQLARVRRAGSTAGVSWSWAALTSVNNAAWLGYFALSGFWTALVPAVSATLLSGQLAIVLARRSGGTPKRPMVLVSAWAVVLLSAVAAFGRTGLGSALAVAFVLQVTPSVWTVYRSPDTAGVSRGTWLLIFGELFCWGVFGIHEADPRLIVLGATGVAASLLVLARVSWPRSSGSQPCPGCSAELNREEHADELDDRTPRARSRGDDDHQPRERAEPGLLHRPARRL